MTTNIIAAINPQKHTISVPITNGWENSLLIPSMPLLYKSIKKSKTTDPISPLCSIKTTIIKYKRGNPAPTLNARLPQKTPSASLGQARCLSNTAITQDEPSPKARRAFPLTQKLSLDHNHATGEPRALLHQQCNLKVAQLETHTKKLNYIISRLMLVELALQFRKKHYQLLCAVLSYTEGLLALRCLYHGHKRRHQAGGAGAHKGRT